MLNQHGAAGDAVSAGGKMIVDVGTFEVRSGTLVVSDPCYGEGVWCQGRLDGVKAGRWRAAVDREPVDGWGKRNAALFAWHEASDVTPLAVGARWADAEFEVGVDSGQAGFWDLPAYGWGRGEYGDTSTFYGKACAATDVANDNTCGAGVMDGGVVSCSGFGDGGYTCSFIRNEQDEIVAAKIVFIGDDEDDDDRDAA
jgi:hypothetical protein